MSIDSLNNNFVSVNDMCSNRGSFMSFLPRQLVDEIKLFVASSPGENPLTILQKMETKGNESLAKKLLFKLDSKDLDDEAVKKVETVLRNEGFLNRKLDPDFVLKSKEGSSVTAHRAILALKSPHFRAMQGFKEFQQGQVETEISQQLCRVVVNYLYLPDNLREPLLLSLDRTLLLDIARVADMWQIEELKNRCDEELCHSIGDLSIAKDDVDGWLDLASILPKFAMLLAFIKRNAGEGELDSVIEKMQTPAGAAQLASKCSPKEVALFSALKTEFGKACRIPEGAFGKAEWEKAFPVTIPADQVPPLPPNIHAILEQPDPWKPEQKLGQTCTLFLRPQKVILHDKEGDKELYLGFDGVEELAKKATHPDRRTKYNTFDALRTQMNQMPVATSGWVLMRKEVIAGSRGKSLEEQQKLLQGQFEVPGIMDAMLLNIITYASEGKYLHGTNPLTYTRCYNQMVVGGFDSSGLIVSYNPLVRDIFGLSGAWKF